jgi:hypothetical protein
MIGLVPCGGDIMALLQRALIVACTLAILLQGGCAGEVTRPSTTDVDISLVVSPRVGSSISPVVADVRITNSGNLRVWHCEGCSCGNGIELTVLGPDGTMVWLRDPKAVGPACPDGFAPLEPSRDVAGRLVFTGTLFMTDQPTVPSPTYPAPAGAYTVVARFSYETSAPGAPGGNWTPLEQRATFTWVP